MLEYCVNIVSVASVSRHITSASRYHPRYQSRSSMYIRGLMPRNFAELAESVPIAEKRSIKGDPMVWLHSRDVILHARSSYYFNNTFEPGSDNRDPLAIKVKSEIFLEKERPSCCEHLQKI